MNEFKPGDRIHIVGVGGAGMSALAVLLSEMGAFVSGSDAMGSATLDELARRGVETFVGHRASQAEHADIVLWSPAVPMDNVELARARQRGATLLSRAQALGAIGETKRLIGLSGTHGKTTATSMMVHVALAAGRDDGWLVGAPVVGVGANGHWGQGDVIVEVDESYGTFELVTPYALGITSIEADHLDYYGTLSALETAFGALVERTRGPVVMWSDDEGVVRVRANISRKVTSVGTSSRAQWRVSQMALERRSSSFVLEGANDALHIRLRVTGAHNVANAALVAVLAHELGFENDTVVTGLSNFVGAPRRYHYRGAWRGVDVYEDYAHLPGEITATLRTVRDVGYERVTVAFQPHRFTRTRALAEELAVALMGADQIIVTDIYSAGEPNPSNVTGDIVVAALMRRGFRHVRYCAVLSEVANELERYVDDSDVILVLGAGDVGQVVDSLPGGLA